MKRLFSLPSDSTQPRSITPTASATRGESPPPTSWRKPTAAAATTRKATAAASRSKPTTPPRSKPSASPWSKSTAATPRRTATTSGGATATGGLGAFGTDGFGLRQEAVEGEQFVAADVELVALLEGGGNDAVLRLHGEVDLVHGAEDLVDFADDGLELVSVCVGTDSRTGLRTLFSR